MAGEIFTDSLHVFASRRISLLFGPMRSRNRQQKRRGGRLHQPGLRLTMIFMCGRFALKHTPATLEEWYEAIAMPDFAMHYNISPRHFHRGAARYTGRARRNFDAMGIHSFLGQGSCIAADAAQCARRNRGGKADVSPGVPAPPLPGSGVRLL
jgi:hypothetical protein